MSDLLSILAERHRAVVSVTLTLDKQVRAEINRLEGELLDVRRDDEGLNRTPEAPGLGERIVALRDSARTITFRFSELARTEWETLIRAHPPLPDHKAAGAEWNADTFPPALFAASCVGWETSDGRSGDGMTLAEAEAWWAGGDGPGFGDARKLWQGALAAQGDASEVPKAEIATAVLHGSAPSSTTPPPEASPTASS